MSPQRTDPPEDDEHNNRRSGMDILTGRTAHTAYGTAATIATLLYLLNQQAADFDRKIERLDSSMGARILLLQNEVRELSTVTTAGSVRLGVLESTVADIRADLKDDERKLRNGYGLSSHEQ